jgi:hypothetical protein
VSRGHGVSVLVADVPLHAFVLLVDGSHPGVKIILALRPHEIQSIGGFPVFLSIQWATSKSTWPKFLRMGTSSPVSNHAVRAVRVADLLANKGFNIAGAVGAQTYEFEGGKLVKVAAPAPETVTDKK